MMEFHSDAIKVTLSKKTCSRCNTEQEIKFFQIRKASKDGYTASCKKCLSEYDKKRANLHHRVEARNKYAKTNEGILAGNRAKIKWSESNEVKRKASHLIGNAVRDKKLTKPSSCQECGKADTRIEGHHDDYAFPLVVRWLCSQCHRTWHKINGPAKNSQAA